VNKKQTFSTVVFVGGLIIVLIFFKSIITAINKLLGNTQSEENEQILATQQAYFSRELDKVKSWYNKSGYKSQQYYKDVADNLEVLFNQNITEWQQIFKILAAYTPKGLWLIYLNFGSRLNREYGNMQGDLYDWIVKESETPLSLINPYPAAVKGLFKQLISMNPKFQ